MNKITQAKLEALDSELLRLEAEYKQELEHEKQTGKRYLKISRVKFFKIQQLYKKKRTLLNHGPRPKAQGPEQKLAALQNNLLLLRKQQSEAKAEAHQILLDMFDFKPVVNGNRRLKYLERRMLKLQEKIQKVEKQIKELL